MLSKQDKSFIKERERLTHFIQRAVQSHFNKILQFDNQLSGSNKQSTWLETRYRLQFIKNNSYINKHRFKLIIMQLITNGNPSVPYLLNINNVQNTIPKNRYVIYYQIPLFPNTFKPLQQISQVLLLNSSLNFKILDLENANSPPITKCGTFIINSSMEASLVLNYNQQGQIKLKGNIINKANQGGIVFSISVSKLSGYLNFLQFRQKYRTLENITRKQNFKLDHRLQVIDGPSKFTFPLQESDHTHYYFTNKSIKIQLQQIYSIEQYQNVELIYEDTITIEKPSSCFKGIISIMQKIRIELSIQTIKNCNFSIRQLAAVRVLQLDPIGGQIVLGTDQLREAGSVKPLLQNRYYDYEFGYLTENLKSEKKSVYEYMDKLTKSFPKYPHFINCQLMQVLNSKMLKLQIKESKQKIDIPFVFILQGLNIIQTQNIKIKFFIEFTEEENLVLPVLLQSQRRIFQWGLKSMWNLGEVSKGHRNFEIKIITPSITYFIPFSSTETDPSSYRKQLRELQYKTEYSETLDNKYFILTKTAKNDKINLIKTQALSPFYLIDLFTSSSVAFQITSDSSVLLQGYLSRQMITSSKHLAVVLSSPNNLMKVILHFDSLQIKQRSFSSKTLYKFMYRLEYTDQIPTHDAHYDLELRRLTDNKRQNIQITPDISDDSISTLHSFQNDLLESGEQDIELNIKLRKMYYNEQTEVFDNSQVINKKLIVNCSPAGRLDKEALFLNLKDEGFTSIDLDFYDDNIQKRLKFHLEVLMKKLPLLDLQKGKYTIKVPPYLWKLNRLDDLTGKSFINVHLSNKSKKSIREELVIQSSQQYSFKCFNYKDGFSVELNGEIGYEKMVDLVKLRCDVTSNEIGWIDESQWHLCFLNVGGRIFYFLLKWGFDPRMHSSDESRQNSARTEDKKGSERSYSQKIDPLAKTVKNMDLLKLKQYKNSLMQQSRYLTAKYVKKEEQIIMFTKKIEGLKEKLQKRKTEQKQQRQIQKQQNVKPAKKKQERNKKIELYQRICQCGELNPKYRGFCENCLSKLKQRYELYMKEYKQKCFEYQRLQLNKFKAKQKYIRAKNRLKEYKNKVKLGNQIEDDSVNKILKQLETSEIRKKIEECKLSLFRLEEDRQNIQRNGKLRLASIEQMIAKEDNQIQKLTNELHQLNVQMQQLKSTMERKNK